MPALSDVQVLNEATFEQLADRNLCKQAEDAVTSFTRRQVRETGFWRKIIPFVDVPNDQLVQQIDDDNPVVIVEKEPGSPAAITVPFATHPSRFYIRGPRYRVHFCRILTELFQKDLIQLRTYRMDIRQVLSDNSVKDMLSEEDSRFLTAVNTAMGGAPDVVNAISGVVQWETLFGGISRDTIQESLKIMEKTPSHLSPKLGLVNNVTLREILKWPRDEVGGDAAQDFMFDGWTKTHCFGIDWISTIKRHLVPDDSIYYFGDPNFIGKAFELEPTTMSVKRENFMIEWFCYEAIGGAIGFPHGLARADFA